MKQWQVKAYVRLPGVHYEAQPHRFDNGTTLAITGSEVTAGVKADEYKGAVQQFRDMMRERYGEDVSYVMRSVKEVQP